MNETMFILFGATGDLTKRKLIPALYSMFKKGGKYPIVCIGRRDYNTKTFIEHLQLDRFCKGAQDKKDFLRQIRYIEVDFEKPHIEKLKAELDEIEEEFRCGPNKLIYLSTPPVLFDKITDWLGNITDQQGWNRVIYEKPFGEDLQTATTLNRKVRKTFSEEQIYRIDHYLGKELVQNILVLRFGNSLLENIWNKENIDSIRIIISEKVGVETRAGYYDKMGAIKDMVQNHMLQLLALTAMEQPVSLSAKHIRDKKVDVLKKVQLPHKDAFIRGQYSKGNSDSNEVESYRTDIEHTSDTETFVAFRTFVDNERWKGVPFYLMTGKRLHEAYAEVNIVLKKTNSRLFPERRHNVISIRIQPDAGISMRVNAKSPVGTSLAPVTMDFCHECEFGIATIEAYEKLIFDAMHGDQTLFTRWDEVRASWQFIDEMKTSQPELFYYPAGIEVPKEAHELLRKDGRKWVHWDPKFRAS